MAEEMRTEYHRHLRHISESLARMLALVEESIAAAASGLLDSDEDAAERVVADGESIEVLHRSIESLVLSQLACQQPVGSDLRFLVAALRIVPEVELTAALATNLVRRSRMHVASELPPRVRGLVASMFDQATDMWREVADAYSARRPDIADSLGTEGEGLDELHAALSAELASGELRPPVLLEMALVARFLERLGDHALEVSRWIDSFTSARLGTSAFGEMNSAEL